MASRSIQAILNFRENMTQGLRRVAGQTQENQRQVRLLHNNVNSFRNSAVSSFSSVAKSAGGLATSFLGIGAATATVFTTIGTVKDYQAALNQLQSSTGATAQEMANMKVEMVDLYKQNFGENWADLADSMAVAKQVTKQSGAALKETTANALIYRDVFKADIPESIKTADTIMKQFGITSTEAFNLLAQGNQKGLDKSGELLDTANEYSVYFAKLGFSANQMFDVFANGLEAGAFNLDKVGDGIKEFGIRAKDGSQSSLDAYKAIKLNGAQMTAQFAKGGVEAQKAFMTTAKAISEIKDPVLANTVSVQLFGTQAEDLEQRVINSYGNIKSQFDMTKKSMEEINNVKYNSVTSAFAGIKRELEVNIAIPIADRVLPKLNDYSNWIKTNMPEIKNSVNTSLSIAKDVFDGFTAAIRWTRDNANWLIPVIAGLTGVIVAQQAIEGITKLYKAWQAASTGLTVAQTLLNIVMAANPFGLLAIGIGVAIGVGVLLWRNWDTVREKASELWKVVKVKFAEGVNFVVDKVNWLIEKLNKIPGVNIPVIAKMKVESEDAYKSGSASFATPKTFSDFTKPKIPKFATGTSYFQGGMARTDEHGGEIKEYPNGTRVIPHDLSKQMVSNSSGGITVNLTIQGNMVGNKEFANWIGDYLFNKITLQQGNV
ncbi:phage tail tape measure protein [Paenibacillus sp. Root444D2]|uniref:phage tail tape measure protein n=1 Tax=Paenibacillus sp. Root444D2 TaxID=1736538 RepID=UPI000709B6B1|nr:phage tail tape measure protein [Paenibacillus sp. Root444D2]KQX69227.1 hypothetical protein ASD40_01635 [Paenibacillus sp. Root444D2]